nr:ankyrin-1-like [Halyomorpha halys]
MVDILLKAGANKHTADIDGMTPLHFAARERRLDMVRLLLDHFTAVNKNKNADTPLHLTCERYNTQNEEDIVSVFSKYTSNHLLMSPLHIGSRDNSIGCVTILLSFTNNLFGDKFLNRPIHYAALNGNSIIVSLFLQQFPGGSSVCNIQYETPLFLASREGHTDVALLLQEGIIGLRPDINGRTTLHRSASRGHLEIMKLIREFRINTEVEDKWGFTALDYAASGEGTKRL